MNLRELKILLARQPGDERLIRITHVPTGVFVEQIVKKDESVLAAKGTLLAELELAVKARRGEQ